MQLKRALTLLAAGATALALSGTATAVASTDSSTPAHPLHATFHDGMVVPAGSGVTAVCPQTHSADIARCLAEVVTQAPGSKRPVTTTHYVNGITPADIASAYKLPSTGGSGMTVALIEAGNYPDIDSDLAVYRSEFGLPACTEANGCLTVVNQKGGSTLPPTRNGWSVETALDVDSVSAACPNCKILVVEANDAHKLHLAISDATAAKLGAVAASNSWKVPEFAAMASKPWTKYFSAPGVAFTASSGDGGHTSIVTIGFPAGMSTVLAVGGTELTKSSGGRGWSETAWSGAGSACGVYIAKPAWQHHKGCKMRSTSDLSADASPDSGLAVYHTLPHKGGGWITVGGTSLSSPLIAGMYGLAGNTGTLGTGIAAHLYANTQHIFDVTTGSNGTCPKDQQYICNAGPGYDGPTGLGTPDGVKAL